MRTVHLGLVLHDVDPAELIFMFLTFCMKTTFFSLRLPDTLEKGRIHCLLGLRSLSQKAVFLSHHIYYTGGHSRWLWGLHTGCFRGLSPAGLTDLSLLRLCPAWGGFWPDPCDPCRFEWRKKRISAKIQEEDSRHPRRWLSFFPSFQPLCSPSYYPQLLPHKPSGISKGQSNAFCNSDPHRALLQYF